MIALYKLYPQGFPPSPTASHWFFGQWLKGGPIVSKAIPNRDLENLTNPAQPAPRAERLGWSQIEFLVALCSMGKRRRILIDIYQFSSRFIISWISDAYNKKIRRKTPGNNGEQPFVRDFLKTVGFTHIALRAKSVFKIATNRCRFRNNRLSCRSLHHHLESKRQLAGPLAVIQ